MKNKKRATRELGWFLSGLLGGILLSIALYRLMNVDLNAGVLTAGAVVTLVAMYVLRLTFWVFKKNF